MLDNKQKTSVWDTENTPKDNFTDNIFKELSWDLNFWPEKEAQGEEKVKDKEYYMKLSLSILSVVNILFIIFLVLGIFYVKVQKNTSYLWNNVIDPFCFVILWSFQEKNTQDYCSSIAALSGDYSQKTSEIKTKYVEWLDSIVGDLYAIENFSSSAEVEFLLSSKINKLKVIDMLNDFDKLKNDFSASDKKLIECKNVKITSDNIFSTTCEVYSSSWEKVNLSSWLWIIWDSWERNDRNNLVEGTSISTAASFLNFIEKNSSYNFQLLEKQKVFQSEFVWEWPYVRKTKVELKLKYNNLKNNLSL